VEAEQARAEAEQAGQKQYSVVAIGVEYGTSSRGIRFVSAASDSSNKKLGTYTLCDRFVRKRSLPPPDDPIIKRLLFT